MADGVHTDEWLYDFIGRNLHTDRQQLATNGAGRTVDGRKARDHLVFNDPGGKHQAPAR